MKMLSIPEIQATFHDQSPKILHLILAVREEILSFLPEHDELIRWKSIAFLKPNAKATVKDSVCYLRPRPRHIEISIGMGVFLNDSHQILKGNGRYNRFIQIKAMEDLPKDALKDILLQSYAFDGSQVLYKLLPNNNQEYQELRKGI